VAIAVALANAPRLLLADEPTGEVDTNTAAVIYKIFQDLNRQLGLTTLIVSHDLTLARHVDRVVAIRDGKLASETIRKPSQKTEQKSGQETTQSKETHEEVVYEELTVLDSAGRLQVPKTYLERYKIKGRARLEPTDDGILILPVAAQTHTLSVEDATNEMAQSRQVGSLLKLLHRIQWPGSKGGKAE
jgi:ABC-type glutathione transport system ATPase component